MDSLHGNVERFTGFAGLYDSVRPHFPQEAVQLIVRYLGHKPKRVVDLGCGTGLSTFAWRTHSDEVIGVEPNTDMAAQAAEKSAENVHFQRAYAHDTGLPSASADVVVCSQSFHWMEPTTTLTEANRILTDGGVFAAVDCDWPPVCDWRAEQAYQELISEVERLIATYPAAKDSSRVNPKQQHLENIRRSGLFRYVREIVFSSEAALSAERLIGLAESQGNVQSMLKRTPELVQRPLERFREAVSQALGEESAVGAFCYRMRLGIK